MQDKHYYEKYNEGVGIKNHGKMGLYLTNITQEEIIISSWFPF